MAAKVGLNGVRPDALDTWEAGFLEDADELHLAMKPMFAGVVKSLATNENVRKKFIGGTAGGEARWNDLIARCQRAYDAAEKRHLRRLGKPALTEASRSDT